VRFDDKVQWNLGPPRMRLEEAALDVASERPTEFGAIEVLADVCQSRRTTAARMLEVAATRRRLRRRRWLMGVLDDISEGSCSVLESGYLNRVERAHALPRAGRQVPGHDRGPLYRDVDYAPWGLVRLGWGQVYGRPCWTAGQVASLLRSRGWRGTPQVCGEECTLAE
jgi:hypothetical protein